MRSKFLSIFVLYFVLVISSGEQCYLEFDNEVPINMTSTNNLGAILKTAEENSSGFMRVIFSTGPILFDSLIQSSYCDVEKYFKNEGEIGETIHIVATSDFNQWDSDRKGTSGDCPFQIRFKTEGCDDFGDNGTTYVDFSIFVEDVNLSAPKFESSVYNLTVTFPMETGTTVNEGIDIFATDNDFSTEELRFWITDDIARFMFTIEPLFPDHSLKQFALHLRPSQEFVLLRDMTFGIEAADSYTNPKIGNTTVNIIVDKINSDAPQPEFKQPLYEANFNRSEVTIKKYLPMTPIIALKDDFGATEEELTVELSTNNEYFAVARRGITFSLIVVKEIDKFNESIIVDVVVRIFDKVDTATVSITVINDGAPPSPPSGGGEKGDSDNTGLLASTIVLALLTACLLGVSAYIFWNYTITKKAPRPDTNTELAPTPSTSNSDGASHAQSSVQVESEKSRKRSMTFSKDDETSRMNRESDGKALFPESDPLNEPE